MRNDRSQISFDVARLMYGLPREKTGSVGGGMTCLGIWRMALQGDKEELFCLVSLSCFFVFLDFGCNFVYDLCRQIKCDSMLLLFFFL